MRSHTFLLGCSDLYPIAEETEPEKKGNQLSSIQNMPPTISLFHGAKGLDGKNFCFF